METFNIIEMFSIGDSLTSEQSAHIEALEQQLQKQLDEIDNNPNWTWVQKQKESVKVNQAFEDQCIDYLTNQGKVISPIFEQLNTNTTHWYDTLNKLY